MDSARQVLTCHAVDVVADGWGTMPVVDIAVNIWG